jgi:hypothetical protein
MCEKKRRNTKKKKKEKMNPFQNMRCYSYAKQWPPLAKEKL